MCRTCDIIIEWLNANALVEDLTKRNVNNDEMAKARRRQSRAQLAATSVLKYDLSKNPGEQYSIYEQGEFVRAMRSLFDTGVDKSSTL